MFHHIKRTASSILLCIFLLAGFSTTTHAQTPSGFITLADLGKSEIHLTGPYDSTTLNFGLPATWQVNSEVQVSLNISTVFNAAEQQYTAGGTLTVSLNRNTAEVILLDQVQTNEYVFNIPAAYMVSARDDGLMEMSFVLDAGVSCIADQQMSVLIGRDSNISFSYAEKSPDTSLVNFPRQIYQRSIFPDFAYVVIPDKPSSAELQSALTVAAGLGNLTSNALSLELIRDSELTEQQKSVTQIIFVGKASSLHQFNELSLPSPVIAGKFQLTDPDLGVIQMVDSPWNRSRVALVVSGNTDAGVIRAAQAISTGNFVPGTSPNLALVEEVQSIDLAPPLASNQTLADMGYGVREFERRGLDSATYSFIVPTGSTLSDDAFFELHYGHSALLMNSRSGIVVRLNGTPFGSVAFNEDTARQTVNSTRVSIPPSLVIPGRNSLEIRVSLEPVDECVDPNLRGLWAVVWPESRLYLPFTPSPVGLAVGMDLDQFPAPMIFNSSLSDTAFVFSRAEPETWRSGLQIAAYLGDRSNGPISQLRVLFDDELGSADLIPYHLIVIGRPSQLDIIESMADVMPVPFDKNSDTASEEFSRIIYQTPADAPVGYLEFFQSPWNNEKVVVAALGNNAKGEEWAASSLYDANLRSQLAGNFAVIRDTNVQTVDTRLSIPVNNDPVVSNPPEQSATPISSIAATPSIDRPAWILPTLIVSVMLALILIGFVIFLNRRRSR